MRETISSKGIFQSKANVLKFLEHKISKSKIEPMFDFTIKEWNNEQIKILGHISKKFNKKIIVRSSAIGEDSELNSGAGEYESILNVSTKSTVKIKKSINLVVKSYESKGNYNNENKILIQSQAEDIIISGVVFTRSENNNSPYYIINFEESDSTTGVTSGKISNNVKIFKNIKKNQIPQKWKFLIFAIKEIEKIVNNDSLDIEFGINKKNEIIIFQVRPLTTIDSNVSKKSDKLIQNIITKNKNKIEKLNKTQNLFGKKTILSDMADWNPAEIIGNKPNLLDYSLYDYLIMKQNWYKGRTCLGYQKINNQNLMISIGGKPYVDVRASFNSLIPNSLNKKTKRKLIQFYLKKLEESPHLHDKVEFEILFSCYDFTLSNRVKELKKSNFSSKEIDEINQELIKFTNNILKNFEEIMEKSQISINHLSKKRKMLKVEKIQESKDHKKLLNGASELLKDCKMHGTLPFSTMARIAFIGSIMLKSLVNSKKIDSHFYNKFMRTITSPISEFQRDLKFFQEKSMSKHEFMKKYGHLRPGTYDITQNRYDQNGDLLTKLKIQKIFHTKLGEDESEKVEKIIKNYPLKFDKSQFLTFVRNALIKREELKFEFSHNLSDALELISLAGKNLGFSKKDLSHLDLNTILKSKKLSKKEIKKMWNIKIQKERKKRFLNEKLELPSLIFLKNDLEIVKQYNIKPNFITEKIIQKNIIKLNSDTIISDIKNKIVLIENADPGFDWIFSYRPSGLITKYGGVASHMAIRCGELSLPASIGCGEILYQKLLNSSKISLDCKNEQIVILENRINDEFIEEEKVLRSLGYIK